MWLTLGHFAVKYLKKKCALMASANKVDQTNPSKEYVACLDVEQKPNLMILSLSLNKLKS